MGKTDIEWTDEVWNPLVGCSRESTECKMCYAERMACRLAHMARAKIDKGEDPGKLAAYMDVVNLDRRRWNGNVVLHEPSLEALFNRRKGCDVFVNSMADFHHPNTDPHHKDRAYAAMALCRGHEFKILTKRADLMRAYVNDPETFERISEIVRGWPTDNFGDEQWASQLSLDWPPQNVWHGVSVGVEKHTHRIDTLRDTHAAVRFLSLEPLLEPLGEIDLTDIHQIYLGCENGPGARWFDGFEDEARRIRDLCTEQGVAFFLKQSPGAKPGTVHTTPELDGKRWTQQWRSASAPKSDGES